MSNTYNAPESFLSKKISIKLIGCGGTGGYIFRELLELNDLLLRLDHQGLQVTCYDNGVVREDNLGRQCFTEYELGMNKAKALVTHEHSLGRCSDWGYLERAFVPSDARGADILITAVDHPMLRFEIGEHYKESTSSKLLWLDAGNDDYTGQCVLGELGNHPDKMLPTCYDLWGEFYNQPDFVNIKSCSLQDALLRQRFGVNKTSARCAGQLLTNLLLSGQLNYHGVYFDVKSQIQDQIEINSEQWSSLAIS